MTVLLYTVHVRHEFSRICVGKFCYTAYTVLIVLQDFSFKFIHATQSVYWNSLPQTVLISDSLSLFFNPDLCSVRLFYLA